MVCTCIHGVYYYDNIRRVRASMLVLCNSIVLKHGKRTQTIRVLNWSFSLVCFGFVKYTVHPCSRKGTFTYEVLYVHNKHIYSLKSMHQV